LREGALLIITTTDPITGEHLQTLRFKPYVIEGNGRLAVKVYFESEETRRTYMQQHSHQEEEFSGQDQAV
jgi:hypothetical protein